MTRQRIRTLPDAGVWIVDTADAVYSLNVNAGTGSRWDSASDGAGEVQPDEIFAFDEATCLVGQPLELEVIAPDYDVVVGGIVLGITADRVDETATPRPVAVCA